MADSKYGDRDFMGIFGNLSGTDEDTIERTRHAHITRERIRSGQLPKDDTLATILEQHKLDYKALAIPFSQSASDHPSATTDDDAINKMIHKAPHAQAYRAAYEKYDELQKEITKAGYEKLPEMTVANLKQYRDAAKNVLTETEVEQLYAILKNYLEDADIELKKTFRDMQEDHPSLRSAITIDDAHPAPLKAFIDWAAQNEGKLSRRDLGEVREAKSIYERLGTYLGSLLKPELCLAHDDVASEANSLKNAAQNEMERSCGYTPPELMEAARYQLTHRHSITPERLSAGGLGICNGSSASIMQAALSSVPHPGHDIVTPEYHWDGYDAVALTSDCKLKEVPRSMPIETYIAEHYKPGGLLKRNKASDVSCMLISNPCSITGKEYSTDALRGMLKTAAERHIPLIVNEMHAGPSADGTPFTSITALPEYEAAKDNVLVIGSITKTCNITYSTPKFSYFYTANKDWARAISNEIKHTHRRRFDLDDVLRLEGYLSATTPEYWTRTEAASTANRDLVEQWMAGVNEKLGASVVKWHAGRPDKGYISALSFAPELLKKAHIHNSLELFEYLYKTAAISTGEMLPSSLTEQNGSHSIRINYGLERNKLEAGLAMMGHAIDQMERGVTLEEARSNCPNTSSSGRSSIEERILSMIFGGSGELPPGVEIRVIGR